MAPGVTVELGAYCCGFVLGEPIPVDVRYRNAGKETWRIQEPLVHRFYDDFEVRGVPNPFADLDHACYDGPVRMHELGPGGTVVIRRYLNECAAFDRPGKYVVKPRAEVEAVRDGAIRTFRCRTGSLEIEILEAPGKEARDAAVEELKALWKDPTLVKREEYARYRPFITDANGRTDALKLLAFRRDPGLLSFWIDRLAEGASFAPEALAGLPDRAAVLEALEERLARDGRERFLWVYLRLAVPKTDDLEWTDVYARRREIEERYR